MKQWPRRFIAMVKEWTPSRGPFARTGCPQRATRSQTVNYQHCSARDTTTFTACCVSGSIPALEKTVAVNVTILLMLISGQLRTGFSSFSCNSVVTSDWTVVLRKKQQQRRQEEAAKKQKKRRQTDRQTEKTPKHERLKGTLI